MKQKQKNKKRPRHTNVHVRRPELLLACLRRIVGFPDFPTRKCAQYESTIRVGSFYKSQRTSVHEFIGYANIFILGDPSIHFVMMINYSVQRVHIILSTTLENDTVTTNSFWFYGSRFLWQRWVFIFVFAQSTQKSKRTSGQKIQDGNWKEAMQWSRCFWLFLVQAASGSGRCTLFFLAQRKLMLIGVSAWWCERCTVHSILQKTQN